MPRKSNIDVLILAILADEPAHGYEIIRKMEQERFSDWTETASSSVYQSLKNLDEQNLVKTKETRVGKSPPRTVYEITRLGRRVLEEMVNITLRQPPVFIDDINIGLFGCEHIPGEKIMEALSAQKEATAIQMQNNEAFLETLDPVSDPWLIAIYKRQIVLYKTQLSWLDEIIAGLKGI